MDPCTIFFLLLFNNYSAQGQCSVDWERFGSFHVAHIAVPWKEALRGPWYQML